MRKIHVDRNAQVKAYNHSPAGQASRRVWLSRHKEEMRQMVDELKKRPCIDCNRTFHPCAMDFDHRDPGQKESTVGLLIQQGKSPEKILAEIAKCDLVCACCHRIRTYARNPRYS